MFAKMNGEDWIGTILSCLGIFLTFFVTMLITKSINIGIGAIAAATCLVGGAYFATIGYVERVVVPRLKKSESNV